MTGVCKKSCVRVGVWCIRCNRSTGLHGIYSAYATARPGRECSRGVPEIQEVLSLNQAQTRDRRVDDSQKTVEISEFTEMLSRGIWIAFMSTGGTHTNVGGMNINPDAIGMASAASRS